MVVINSFLIFLKRFTSKFIPNDILFQSSSASITKQKQKQIISD